MAHCLHKSLDMKLGLKKQEQQVTAADVSAQVPPGLPTRDALVARARVVRFASADSVMTQWIARARAA